MVCASTVTYGTVNYIIPYGTVRYLPYPTPRDCTLPCSTRLNCSALSGTSNLPLAGWGMCSACQSDKINMYLTQVLRACIYIYVPMFVTWNISLQLLQVHNNQFGHSLPAHIIHD